MNAALLAAASPADLRSLVLILAATSTAAILSRASRRVVLRGWAVSLAIGLLAGANDV